MSHEGGLGGVLGGVSARSDVSAEPTLDVAEWESTYREHAPRLMRMAALLVGPADAGGRPVGPG